MNSFDIVFCIFSLVFVILGIFRGFITEVIRLIAVVAGFICGLIFYRQFSVKLSFLHLSQYAVGVVSFLTIFFGCVVIILLVGIILKKVINLTALGWFDRLGGGFVGLIKAFFIAWVFVIAVSSLPFSYGKNFFKDSRAYSFFIGISPVLKASIINHAIIRPEGKAWRKPGLPSGKSWNSSGTNNEKNDSPGKKKPAKKNPPVNHENTL
jgi:membrane protein required for colicin V production